MEVTEAAQNPAVKYEEAIKGSIAVKSAVRKQYLESAKGHFLSALAGLNAGKQEQAKIHLDFDTSSVLEDNSLEQATEAEPASVLGTLEQARTFSEMDAQIHLHSRLLKASEKRFQAMEVQLEKSPAKNTKFQMADMVSRIGAFRKEMRAVDGSEVEAIKTAPSQLGSSKESLSKGLIEGSSLQRMVQSLKAQLEELKKEHAELKDKDAAAEFTGRNLHCKFLQRRPEKEGCLAKEDEVRQIVDDLTPDLHEVEDVNINTNVLKRGHEASNISKEVEKRPRLALDAVDQSKSLPGRMCSACVSTSESSARIMISEDELESSSQKVGKSNELERERLIATTGQREADSNGCASEFSIRDYVFAARSKDISMNWPFSQKNLQLCLKHGVKNVLPPFHPTDSLRDSSMKRCIAEMSLHSEESNLEVRPSLLKNHLVPGNSMDHRWNQEVIEGYRDSNSPPSGGEKDLAFKTTETPNAQSEVESVSTSNLPLSEVSDERGAAASVTDNKPKSSTSQFSNKKCRVAMKMQINSYRGAAEDTTSACTVPSEAMTSKICPVCETFSSSSNTTLNAHIDQCLSSQSTSNWVKNSKLSKPRIKPRKMRLMADICATAPCCTLEDLDRRNGTNWASTSDFPTQDAEAITEGKNRRVLPRYVVNNSDNGAVYIDSSGRKIRILSKFNDTSASSSPKARDIRPKKYSGKGNRSKLFRLNRKRHLGKHFKYLKVAHQRKRFSSLKASGHSNEASRTEEATCAVGENRVKKHLPAPFVKDQEQKNAAVSGTSSRWISSRRSSLSNRDGSAQSSKHCRYKMQPTEGFQSGIDQPDTEKTHVRKHSTSPKKSMSSSKSRLRSPTIHRSGLDQKGDGSCGRTSCSYSLRGATRGNREAFRVPLKLDVAAHSNVERTKEDVLKSKDPTVIPASSLEREAEVEPDTVGKTDSCSPGNNKLLHSSQVSPSEGSRPHNSTTKMRSPSPSFSCTCQSSFKRKGSALEEGSCGCRRYETKEAWSADISQWSGAKPDHPQSSEELGHGHDGSRDSGRTDRLADQSQDNNSCPRSPLTGLHNNKAITTPFSSSSLVVKETVVISSRSLNPELQKVADASDPSFESLDCSDKFQNPCLSSDCEMFDADESLKLQTRDSDVNIGRESSLSAVDPIPIPGPPGSDLPSFSDMSSEDLHLFSSLKSGLAQSCGDGDDDMVDGDVSDSQLSATSTISNFEPDWLGTSCGTTGGISPTFSPFIVSRTGCFTSFFDISKESMVAPARGPLTLSNDNQRCSSSLKEGVPWSAALKFEESQAQQHREVFKLTGSTSNSRPRTESENLAYSVETSAQRMTPMDIAADSAGSFVRAGDSDYASPAAPTLRLMGKDVMIINNDDDDRSKARTAQNVCTDRQVLPLTEISSGIHKGRVHWTPESTAFIGALLHEQDPRTLSVQHLDVGSSNRVNNFRSSKPSSRGVYVNNHMRANFPLQR